MMTREEWARAEKLLFLPDVQDAMRARCEEQGHEWENCCTMFMQVYRQCKWCGDKKR